MLKKPKDLNNQSPTPLKVESGKLSIAMSRTVEDIFRKFDLLIGRELSFSEFSVLYKMIGDKKDITEAEFNKNFLKKYCSTSEGLTVRGLQDFFLESINTLGEDTVRAWLSNLGYDEHLFNP